MELTFKKNGLGEYVASSGEVIAYYKGTELWGRGSSGWYITETNGDFRGLKFDTLNDAKYYLVKKHNSNSDQFSAMFKAKIEKVLA